MRPEYRSEPSRCFEQELILCAARTRLDASRREQINLLLRRDLDWIHLLSLAERHRVSPLLYWHLSSCDHQSVPREAWEILKSSFEQTARENLSRAAELIRLMDLAHAHSILAIPYKGPALAALAYGNLALREFSDLDLLIRQRDLPRFRELLAAGGYQSTSAAPEDSSGSARYPRHYSFAGPRGGFLELHTEKTSLYFPKPLNLDALAARRVPLRIGGREILSLPLEDALPMLSVNGSQHFWDRLAWIVDIAELLHHPIDWEKSFAQANRLGCQTMLLLSLYLADELLEAPVTATISRRAHSLPQVRQLAKQIFRRMFREPYTHRGIIQRLHFRIAVGDSVWKGLHYSLRSAAQPDDLDVCLTPISDRSGRLQDWLGPLRRLQELGGGWKQRIEPDLAPYDPTPPDVIEQMLALADLQPNDVLYDLGCGDGRIVIAAAKQFGIHAVGVDLDAARIRQARDRAQREGLAHLVRFVNGDLRGVQLSEATVVTMYLTLLGNIKLRQKLEAELKPATRVVSRDFQVPGWVPLKTKNYHAAGGEIRSLYLWRVGAAAQRRKAARA